MMIRERGGVPTLIVGGEQYWLARTNPLADRCALGHELLGAQTVAGVWFVVDEQCEHAWLADATILDAICARPPAAKATIALPPLLEAGL